MTTLVNTLGINQKNDTKTPFKIPALKAKQKYVLEITFQSGAAQRKLNQKSRNINLDTDVLSFSHLEEVAALKLPPPIWENLWSSEKNVYLGHLYLSLPKIKSQAKEFKQDMSTEAIQLIIHGMLHIVGFDHEHSKTQAKKMARWENTIYEKFLNF